MCADQTKRNKVIAWLPLGIILPVIAMSLPRFIHPSASFPEDWLDGLRGLVAGIGFGIMIMVIVKLSRQRRSDGA
jgi:uncharacterized membrane protein